MSPQASMVGRASLDWDVEIFWPQPNIVDALNVNAALNDARYVSTGGLIAERTADRRLVGSTSSTGTGSSAYTAGAGGGAPGGLPCIRVQATAAMPDQHTFGMEGMRAILDTTGVVPLGLGASWPSLLRVWWLQALIRYRDDGGGPATNESGMLVVPTNEAQNCWPTQIVGNQNRGGFGLVGDGAGQWQYSSWDRTGVGLLREAVALPAHTLDDFNLAEWVMVGARPGFNSYIEFWFNNTLILTRNWLGGMLEPIGGVVPADVNEWCWAPYIRQGGFASVFVGSVVSRQGRFLRDGTEIQG